MRLIADDDRGGLREDGAEQRCVAGRNEKAAAGARRGLGLRGNAEAADNTPIRRTPRIAASRSRDFVTGRTVPRLQGRPQLSPESVRAHPPRHLRIS